MARSSSVRALLPETLRRRQTDINIGTWRLNLVLVLLLASLLFGGSSLPGLWVHTLLHLIALIVLVPLMTLFVRDYRATTIRNITFLLLGAIVAIPLVQQVPIPPGIWRALPGRDVLVSPDVMAGDAWRPITLSPTATWSSFFSLFPLIGVFIGTWLLSWPERRILCKVLLGFGVFSALLGILQLGAGPDSALRFYEITSAEDPVGFFGSRNNFAALLYSLLPLAVVWVVVAIQQGPESPKLASHLSGIIALAGCVVLFLMTLFLARSRAGFGLGLLALIASLAMSVRWRGNRSAPRSRTLLWSIIGFALLVAGFYGLDRVLPRFDVEEILQYRSVIAQTTREAVWHFFPVGTGMGTFQGVYQMFEKPGSIVPSIVNRAHNEYLELLLETGVFGAILFLGFLAWFIAMLAKVFAKDGHDSSAMDRMLQRAAALIVVLLLIHSSVDFVLRTSAIAGILAFALAMLLEPIRRSDGGPSHRPSEANRLR